MLEVTQRTSTEGEPERLTLLIQPNLAQPNP